MTLEEANYIIAYYGNLLPLKEHTALRHYMHTWKMKDVADKTSWEKVSLKAGWITNDPEILKLLEKGYDHFAIITAEMVLKQHPDKIYLNNCPQCGKLARTPFAKQCRYCRHDWH